MKFYIGKFQEASMSPAKEEAKRQTIDHREEVKKYLTTVAKELTDRGSTHDESKLSPEEMPYFAKHIPELNKVEYGSPEYKQAMKDMKPAIDHHNEVNRHHPEHFKDGMKGMNLVDLAEMVADWKAAAKRYPNGDAVKAMDMNQKRFGFSDDIKAILLNTLQLWEGK